MEEKESNYKKFYKETEYSKLYDEKNNCDSSCLIIMGTLITITGSAIKLWFDKGYNEAGIFISIVWLIGYLYLAEKRFTIKQIAYYFEKEIQVKEGYEYFRKKVLKDKTNFRVFNKIGPFYLESFITILSISMVVVNLYYSSLVYYITSLVLWLVGMVFVLRTILKYNNWNKDNK